jgi:hypothetical protein
MLEDLFNAGKINAEDRKIYLIFHVSESGREWLQSKMLETFLEQPPLDNLTGELIAFIDGRRSLIREIHFALTRIENLIKENQNDNGRQEQ